MKPELQEHRLFSVIDKYIDYYDLLSFGIMGIGDSPVAGLLNLDTFIIETQKNCLSSIKEVVFLGHLNDGYALLRKYYDGFVINIFERIEILKIEDSLDIFSKTIQDWASGKKKLPSYKAMLSEIMNCSKIKKYTSSSWLKEKLFKIRVRCDDHVHSNYFAYMQYNNDVLWFKKEKELLDLFEQDVTSIFCAHFLFLFEFAPYYMAASDYMDYLELGMQPPEGCEYDVAPFIKDTWINIVCKWNYELAGLLKRDSVMRI